MSAPAARLWLLLALSAALPGCRKTTAEAPKLGYDAAPFTQSLRESERREAASNAGVKALDALPLYELELDVSDDLAEARVEESLHYSNTTGAPLDELVLRVHANAAVETPPVKLVRSACERGPKCAVVELAPSFFQVKLEQPLPPAARLELRLAFQARLSIIEPGRTNLLAQGFESLERLKAGKAGGDYGLLARGDEIASFASFFAVLGRFRDGKWEKSEPSTLGDLGADGLSHVRARVRAPSDVKVVASGTITRSRSLESGDAGARIETEIVAGLVRDFALLLSSRFESQSRRIGGVEVRSHYLAKDASGGARVLDAAASALDTYEKLFGPYPYVDLDVVEAPLVGGAGGVEFSGLVTVASMLYRPAMSEGPLGMLTGLLGGGRGPQLKELTDSMLEFVTAHEVAHQWWPGLVGSDSRSHPWVDESMAQWSAVLYVRERHGAERAKLEAEREILANYHTMRLFGLADAPVDRPVEAFGGEVAYAGLVYGKGPFLYRELENLVGEEKFFAATRAYVKKHRFKTAPARGLIDELAVGEHEAKVRELAKRWLDEAHGDEDLGRADLRKLLAGFIGEEAAKAMGPELDVAMKLLFRLLAPSSDKAEPMDLMKELLNPER